MGVYVKSQRKKKIQGWGEEAGRCEFRWDKHHLKGVEYSCEAPSFISVLWMWKLMLQVKKSMLREWIIAEGRIRTYKSCRPPLWSNPLPSPHTLSAGRMGWKGRNFVLFSAYTEQGASTTEDLKLGWSCGHIRQEMSSQQPQRSFPSMILSCMWYQGKWGLSTPRGTGISVTFLGTVSAATSKAFFVAPTVKHLA